MQKACRSKLTVASSSPRFFAIRPTMCYILSSWQVVALLCRSASYLILNGHAEYQDHIHLEHWGGPYAGMLVTSDTIHC